MNVEVAIAGAGHRICHDVSIEAAVHQVVSDALTEAGVALSSIDMVVTVGSDILDGGMVGTRSGIAGAYGHELMTVPSSAGHAFAAAMSLLESGQARSVLVAGWGEGTKFAEVDGRIVQADPFYARPVGADATAMAALQAQRLLADGRLDLNELASYAAMMRRRAGVADDKRARMATWLTPLWSDGACALVLLAGKGSVHVTDVSTSFRSYCPEPADLDPGMWVEEAMARVADAVVGNLAIVEVGGPTAVCEIAALAPIFSGTGWRPTDGRVNPSGGGAAAFFGPATGLRHIATVFRTLAARPGAGISIDLAGPIGQATTVIALETRR
jgi:hypothetical protein